MFQPPETLKPDRELEERLRESFGRLRAQRRDEVGAQAPETADEDGEGREPSLPAKLFIGPNATWYDDRWRWMDWRGSRRSWNWAAAATFGTWFGYRRMYGWLLVYGLSALGALALAVAGAPLLIPLVLLIAGILLAGLYGNHLYLSHFRRAAGRILAHHHDHEDQVRAVVRAGGVNRRIAWLWPAFMVLAALAIVLVVGLGPTVEG